MQELNDIRVTWQLTVVVSALAVLPIAGVALVSSIAEHSQRGEGSFRAICSGVIIVTLLMCLLAIRSRLAPVATAEDRVAILKQIGLGFLAIVAAAAVTAVSYFFGTVFGLGSQWYLIPTGLYGVGLVMIGKAMVPEDAQ